MDFGDKQLDAADVPLFGRRSYELMASFWPTEIAQRRMPETARRMTRLQKVVFSKTLGAAGWENTRLIKDGVAEELGRIKSQPGKHLLILGSNNLSVGLIEAGLLDEVRLMVCPVAIGRGNALFSGLSQRLKARLAATREFPSGNVC